MSRLRLCKRRVPEYYVKKKQADHWRVPRPVNKVPRVLVTPNVALMDTWPWRCISTVQDDSNELDLEWISLVVAAFRCPQDSRSPFHAHGHAHYAPMGIWLWRCTCKGQGGSSELDLEWIGPMVAEFQRPQDPRSPYQGHGDAHYVPWANNHDVAHLQAQTIKKNLIWSESVQWFRSSGVRKIPEALITGYRCAYYAHVHAHVAPMGKWPDRCSSRGRDSSNEHDLEWIGPVVAGLLSYGADERTDGKGGGQ